MSISAENQAFHEMIKKLNLAHYKYNQGNIQATKFLLNELYENCGTVIHHLSHKEQEGNKDESH